MLALLTLLSCADKAADSQPPVDSDSGQISPDPATVPLAGACPLPQDFGGFVVSMGDDGAGVNGTVADGVVPTSVLEQIAAEGDCQLLRRNNPYCEETCDPGTTCDFTGECVPYPANQDLGTVTVRGLVQSVSMEPVFPGNTYYDTSLSSPPFQPGALVTLNMPQGGYGPLTLYGVGVDPLAGVDPEWVVEEGQDLIVRWQPPSAVPSRAQVAMSINIDQHGATPGTLHCLFDDDGEGLIPGAILSELVSVGVTGFPNGAMQRRTVDSGPAGDGCMDFTVLSAASVPVDVVGYTPCVGDDDCPDGQTCNIELQICE